MPGNSSSRCAAMRSSSGRNRLASASRGHRDEPGDVVGHLHPGEALRAVVRVAHRRPPGSATARRCTGTGAPGRPPAGSAPGRPGRGSTRAAASRSSSSSSLPAARCWMPSVGQRRARRPRRRPSACRATSSLGALADAAPAARGGAARRRDAHRQAGLAPALQAGDAHHVELVEVAGEDRQELDPLQQRLASVLGQRQHPGVEVQPGQLAVEEAVGVLAPVRRCVSLTASWCRTGWTPADHAHASGRCRPGPSASAAVRGPVPSARASARCSVVSTSRRNPGHPPSGPPPRPPRAPRPTRGRTTGARSTGGDGQQGGPGALGVGDEGPEVSAAVASASASSPGAQRRQVRVQRGHRRGPGLRGTVGQGCVQPGAGGVGRDPRAQPPGHPGDPRVVGDHPHGAHGGAGQRGLQRVAQQGEDQVLVVPVPAPVRTTPGRPGAGPRAQPRLCQGEPFGWYDHRPPLHPPM